MVIHLHSLLLIFHLTALAIGLGAALLADWIAVTRLLFGRLSARAAAQLQDLSTAVSVGLAMLWCSGAMLVWDNALQAPETLVNEKLWAKLVIVTVLTLNAILLHRLALPLVRARVGQPLFERRQHGTRVLCALIAAVSFTSWISALYLGAVPELNGTVTMADVLSYYLGALLLVWLAGVVLCHIAGVNLWIRSDRRRKVDHFEARRSDTTDNLAEFARSVGIPASKLRRPVLSASDAGYTGPVTL